MNIFSLAPMFVRALGQRAHVERLLNLIAPALPHLKALQDEAAPAHIIKACALLDPHFVEIDALVHAIVQGVTQQGTMWGVTRYQLFLSDLGLYRGAIDGKHGEATDAAVRAYQQQAGGLEIDGYCGPATMARMIAQGA